MKKGLIGLALVFILGLASVSFAGEEVEFGKKALKQGNAEVGINNNQFMVGYFVTDELEVSALGNLMFGDIDVISIGLGARFHVNADMGNIVPFGEAALLFSDSSDDNDNDLTTTTFSIGGGVRMFVSEVVSVNLSLNLISVNSDAGGESDTTTEFGGSLGLSAFIF